MGQLTESYFRFLGKESDFLEAAYHRETFTEGELRRLLKQYDRDAELSYRIEKLLDYDVVEYVAGDERDILEVAAPIRQLIDFIRNEHPITTIEEIRGVFNALQNQLYGQPERELTGLRDLIGTRQFDTINRRLDRIDRYIRKIEQYVEHSQNAIEDAVEALTQETQAQSIKDKYEKVLEYWEEYVDPLGQLIDPQQDERKFFRELKNSLSAGSRDTVHTDKIKQKFSITRKRLQYVREFIKRSYHSARHELQPLRSEYKRNSKFMKGASAYLQAKRKQIDPPINSDEHLRIPSEQDRGISDDRKIYDHLCRIQDYEQTPEEPIQFDQRVRDLSPPEFPHDLLELVRNEKNIGNLMKFLIDRGDNHGAQDIINAYVLSLLEADQCQFSRQKQSYELDGLTVRLYPVALYSDESLKTTPNAVGRSR